MMDYSNGKEENFILNFKEKGDKIIVNFAHKQFKKNSLKIDNTEENKNKILDAMRQQVESVNRDDAVKKIKTNKIMAGLFTVLSLFGLFMFVFSVSLNATLGFFCWLFLTTFFIGIDILFIENYIILNDGLKSIMFLENEEKLNNLDEKKQSVVLDNTTKKVEKIIINKKEEEPIFNINDIDKLSYNELKRLLECIKKMESFNFEINPIEDKKLVLEQK